jgi:hypothetical protein
MTDQTLKKAVQVLLEALVNDQKEGENIVGAATVVNRLIKTDTGARGSTEDAPLPVPQDQQQAPEPAPQDQPVSYTHLTLPTT